jgi:DNA-binding response OmpR family regulator
VPSHRALTRTSQFNTIVFVKKVLVVESLKPLAEQEKKILSNRGLEIFTAASGEEALAVHRHEKVDLIVARLDMPGTAGDSLCSLIRHDETMKKVSFILICDNTKDALERCRKCGANSYITRPLDPEKFVEKVGQLIEVQKRTGMRVLIKVSVKSESRNQSFFCTSLNISTSGILLEVDRTISKGASISCSFFIPGSDSITVEGEIVRVSGVSPNTFHWGVKFLNLQKNHRSAIEAFVKKKT